MARNRESETGEGRPDVTSPDTRRFDLKNALIAGDCAEPDCRCRDFDEKQPVALPSVMKPRVVPVESEWRPSDEVRS